MSAKPASYNYEQYCHIYCIAIDTEKHIISSVTHTFDLLVQLLHSNLSQGNVQGGSSTGYGTE